MARAGAGNSRGLSGWRSPSGESSPAFLLPGRAGASGSARAWLPEWVGGRRVSQLQPSRGRRQARATAAAPPQQPREPRAPQRPRSRPPPPGRPRLLPSHTPRAARAPGLPGAPPPSLHTLLRPGCCCGPPASLSPGRVLLLLRLSFHTHTRAPWLSGPPPFLQPSSPSQSFKRRRRGWAED